MNNIIISDILRPLRDDQTAFEDDFFRVVIEKLETNRTGCVCVIDHAGRPTGIVTDGDVRRFVFNAGGETLGSLFAHAAIRMANPALLSARADRSIWECLQLMHDRRIGAIPIVSDGGKLIGIVNLQDLLGGILSKNGQR